MRQTGCIRHREFHPNEFLPKAQFRFPKEFDESHISGSINIPLNLLLDKHFLFINKTKHYYIICKNGSKSNVAAKVLSECGYNVTNIVGGITRWPGSFVKNNERAYY